MINIFYENCKAKDAIEHTATTISRKINITYDVYYYQYVISLNLINFITGIITQSDFITHI